MAIATRSPARTPYRSISVWARPAAMRKCSSNVMRSSSYTRNVASPWALDCSSIEPSVGGAFFHTRTGTPRMVSVPISNIWPSAVRRASASRIERVGASPLLPVGCGVMLRGYRRRWYVPAPVARLPAAVAAALVLSGAGLAGCGGASSSTAGGPGTGDPSVSAGCQPASAVKPYPDPRPGDCVGYAAFHFIVRVAGYEALMGNWKRYTDDQ